MTLSDYNFLLSAMERVVSLHREIPESEKKESFLENRINSMKHSLRDVEENLTDSRYIRKTNSTIKEPEHPGDLDKRKIMIMESEIETIQNLMVNLKSEYKQVDNEIIGLKNSLAGRSLLKTLFSWGNANQMAEIHMAGFKRGEISRKIQLERDKINTIKSRIKSLKEDHKSEISTYDRYKKEHFDLLKSLEKERDYKERVFKLRLGDLNQSINSTKSELEQTRKKILETNQEIISALESVAHLTPHNSKL